MTNDGDGDEATPAETHTYSYDTAGNLIEDIIDADSDGVDDTKYEYLYDAKGNAVLESRFSWDEENEEWMPQSDWSNAWYYVYNLQLRNLPDRVSFNRGDDETVDDYIHVTWKLYTAPIQAEKLLDLDLEDFELMFLQTDEAFVPGL
jgi:YD repeat-containing protein